MSGVLVGPLPTVQFRGGARVVADPPRSTLDLRWVACSDHHTACDCREAELNEQLSECRAEAEIDRRTDEAVTAVLRIHTETPGRGGYCRGCHNQHPCPTRTLLLPHSWTVRFEETYR